MSNFFVCTVIGVFIAAIIFFMFEWDLDTESERILSTIMLIFILIGAGFGIYGTVQAKNHTE